MIQLLQVTPEQQAEKAEHLRDVIQAFLESIQSSKTNPIVITLIVLMIIDVFTGVLAAAITNEVDSSYSYRGVLKKGQMLLMVAAAMMFEFIYPDFPWSKLVAGFICLTELISITENVGKSGVPLPKQLKDTLKRLREEKEHTAKLEVKVEAPSAKEVVVESTLKPKKKDSTVRSDIVKNINGSVTTTSTIENAPEKTETEEHKNE